MDNFDGGFWNFEMLGQHLDKSNIGFTVVRFGAKIYRNLAWGDFNDFFLRTAWFYGNGVFHAYII